MHAIGVSLCHISIEPPLFRFNAPSIGGNDPIFIITDSFDEVSVVEIDFVFNSTVPFFVVSVGVAWLGVAWLGVAWLGVAWLGVAYVCKTCVVLSSMVLV